MNQEPLFIGIDVGTGSARAAIFDTTGNQIAAATKETQTWRSDDDPRVFEQSTNDIWSAICSCVRQAMQQSGASKESIKGIGFDATCSLAVTDDQAAPVCVTSGPTCGDLGERNIILWADHRAEQEANLINSTGSVVLDYVGGSMSFSVGNGDPEDSVAKEKYARSKIQQDFLTYRATSSTQRSSCSLVCKCSYIPESGWQSSFFEKIGLEELVRTRYKQVGEGEVLTAGMPVGKGLTSAAATELGLHTGTAVGSAVIDAYAGWIGTIGARYKTAGSDVLSPPTQLDESKHRMAAVAGTSTCHLVQSQNGVYVPGVWGPYRDAVFPGWWMNEGGQSSTGQLIDFIIKTHPAFGTLQEQNKRKGLSVHKLLEAELKRQQEISGCDSLTELTRDIHIYPDLHGNRSPIADPKMRGSIVGLTLDDTLGDLARKFNATLEAIALQTRHIIDEMNKHGHDIQEIYMSGGQAANFLLMQLLANICSLPVILPHSHSTAVVLGAAMLGRFAAEHTLNPSTSSERLWGIMVQMTPPGTVLKPAATATESSLLEAKYRIFIESIAIQSRWRQQMAHARSA